MRLVYAVVERPDMHVVRVTDQKPNDAAVDETTGTWNNYYRRSPAPTFGQFVWWSGYKPGTTIGVYDIDDLHHLTLLANLVSNIQNQETYDRMPGRESSI